MKRRCLANFLVNFKVFLAVDVHIQNFRIDLIELLIKGNLKISETRFGYSNINGVSVLVLFNVHVVGGSVIQRLCWA